MNLRNHLKKLLIGIFLILIGTVIVFPVEAHIVRSKNAHTLNKKHLSWFAPRSWVTKYFYTKTQSNSRYYTKSTSNSRYYTNTQVDSLLSNYLTTSNAASTYLTSSAGNSAYVDTSGDTMTGALIAPDYNYSSAKTRYLMIPAHEFVPRDGDLGLNYTANTVFKSAGFGQYAYAPVVLPDGAVIKRFRLYYYDNEASGMVQAKLTQNYSNGTSTTIENITSIGGSGYDYADSSVYSVPVDYSSGEYYSITATFETAIQSANLSVLAVRIEYQISSP